MAAFVVALSAWAPASRVLGVGPAVTAPLATVSALSIVHAAVAFHEVGVFGQWYRIAEHIESVCSVSCGVLIIYFSGSAISVFWIYFIVYIVDTWNTPLDGRTTISLYAAATAALTAAFALRGEFLDATIAGSLTVMGTVCCYAFIASAKARLRGDAERRVLRAELEQLRFESERDRIARELHDGIAADLTALVLRARALKASVGDEAAKLVDGVVQDARRSLDELRDVVFELRASDRGWPAFVEDLRRRTNSLCGQELTSELIAREEVEAREVPLEARVQVLRIVQEGVRNAVRHARPSHVRVELERGCQLVVRVIDDGEGIPDDALAASSGGLSNIRERTRLLGGSVSWSRQAGTRLIFTLPLPAAPSDAP